jgi:hypothetical protein
MCTVTVIPLFGPGGGRCGTRAGFRLVINRDELRTRPIATRPSVATLSNGLRGAWPVDPAGGGTWVGVGAHGLVMATMNVNPTPKPSLPPAKELISRGTLIPMMLDADSAHAAVSRLAGVDTARMPPFRVVAVDGRDVIEASWNREELNVTLRPLQACCFASSGLGDVRAEPRLGLFDAWMGERGVSPAAQDAFHTHQWADRPEVSVRMCRSDARTVSTTSVRVYGDSGADGIVMDYRDDDGECRVVVTPLRGRDEDEPAACATAGEPGPC